MFALRLAAVLMIAVVNGAPALLASLQATCCDLLLQLALLYLVRRMNVVSHRVLLILALERTKLSCLILNIGCALVDLAMMCCVVSTSSALHAPLAILQKA